MAVSPDFNKMPFKDKIYSHQAWDLLLDINRIRIMTCIVTESRALLQVLTVKKSHDLSEQTQGLETKTLRYDATTTRAVLSSIAHTHHSMSELEPDLESHHVAKINISQIF